MAANLYVLLTMDCETARQEVSPHGTSMSASGPQDYEESERAIQGYASIAEGYGLPMTLFAHAEVAVGNRDLLLDLQSRGHCLGLHLHPYKFAGRDYWEDLGAYSAQEQREMLSVASKIWQRAHGQKPLYFRAGYFSANDSTFGVLHELGFRGGSLSNPGRVLAEHCSVWAGAEPYPHRSHPEFRQIAGMSNFVEVPISVDYQRPVQSGAAGEQGYEWPYVPAPYNHREVVKHVLERIRTDVPEYGALVLDTHNDQDYLDPTCIATANLRLILDLAFSLCEGMDLHPVGATLETMCDLLISEET
jgi:peptidoglycan/xylan/chitin deacetylase (PgdA/CDA1 family)